MEEQFVRMALIFGEKSLEDLGRCRVAVFGVGGVGGYVVEALARCGVGALDLIDHDTVSLSNINRQILATHSTVGKPKVEAARDRVLDINPSCRVRTYQTFFLPKTELCLTFPNTTMWWMPSIPSPGKRKSCCAPGMPACP